MYVVLSPLVRSFSCRPLKILMNSLSFLTFMGRTRMVFMLYLYFTSSSLFPLVEVTVNSPVGSVTIFLLWSTILMKNVLVRRSSCVIGVYSCPLGYCGLVYLRFFPV